MVHFSFWYALRRRWNISFVNKGQSQWVFFDNVFSMNSKKVISIPFLYIPWKNANGAVLKTIGSGVMCQNLQDSSGNNELM
jgi:hypothetical protein